MNALVAAAICHPNAIRRAREEVDAVCGRSLGNSVKRISYPDSSQF